MNRPITACWSLTADELSRALKHHARHANFLALVLLAFGGASLVIAALIYCVPGTLRWSVVGNLLLMVALSFVWWGLVASQGMARLVIGQRLRAWPHERKVIRWTISEEGLRSDCGEFSASWRWEMIEKAVGTPRGVLIYPFQRPPHGLLGPFRYSFTWIPRRAFGDETEFRGFLELARCKSKLYTDARA